MPVGILSLVLWSLAAMGVSPDEAAHPHVLAAVPAFAGHVRAGRDRLFFEIRFFDRLAVAGSERFGLECRRQLKSRLLARLELRPEAGDLPL